MVDKLLGPDGKSYTTKQLDSFSMRKVFDFLIDMGVADDDQYYEFRDLNTSRRSRKRKRSRSRSRSRPRKRSRTRTRYVVVYRSNGSNGNNSRRQSSAKKYRTNCGAKGYYSCTEAQKATNPVCRWNSSRNICEHT